MPEFFDNFHIFDILICGNGSHLLGSKHLRLKREKLVALTGSDKQKYNELIQMLWKGSVPSSVAQITSEVADIVDKVIDEIYDCSNAFAGTIAFITSIGGVWILPRMLIKEHFEGLLGWLIDVQDNTTYKACSNQATLNWKSSLTLALMGL